MKVDLTRKANRYPRCPHRSRCECYDWTQWFFLSMWNPTAHIVHPLWAWLRSSTWINATKCWLNSPGFHFMEHTSTVLKLPGFYCSLLVSTLANVLNSHYPVFPCVGSSVHKILSPSNISLYPVCVWISIKNLQTWLAFNRPRIQSTVSSASLCLDSVSNKT